jgi:hypothetical protein
VGDKSPKSKAREQKQKHDAKATAVADKRSKHELAHPVRPAAKPKK